MIAPEVIKNVQGIDIRYPYGVTEPNYSIIDVQERKWNDKSYLLPIYLDEMQKNLRVLLAIGRCNSSTRQEIHDMVDEIFDGYDDK